MQPRIRIWPDPDRYSVILEAEVGGHYYRRAVSTYDYMALSVHHQQRYIDELVNHAMNDWQSHQMRMMNLPPQGLMPAYRAIDPREYRRSDDMHMLDSMKYAYKVLDNTRQIPMPASPCKSCGELIQEGAPIHGLDIIFKRCHKTWAKIWSKRRLLYWHRYVKTNGFQPA